MHTRIYISTIYTNLESWEFFLLLLLPYLIFFAHGQRGKCLRRVPQSNGKSGFSFELKTKTKKKRCTKSENLPASNRVADHRFGSSVHLVRFGLVFPAARFSPPTSFCAAKV